MSPIIRSKVQSIESLPHFPLSETKFSVVLDKTQDIILELLINSTEIYLAQEEFSQNKENYISSSEQKFGKGSKGNKLKAPYKDKQCGIESIPQTTSKRPFHYKDPKESLFYKERMAKVKKTIRLGGKERHMKTKMKNQQRRKGRKYKMGGKIDKTGQGSHTTGGQSKTRC